MVPLHDDLISTISDNDSVTDSQDEQTQPSFGRKRKRDGVDSNVSKKAKKGRSQGNTDAEEQDDMDEEFSFELEDQMNTIDGFDGWASSTGLDTPHRGRHNEASQIDEIVARLHVKSSGPPQNGISSSYNDKEDESEQASNSDDGEIGEDDETSAPDGFGMGATLEHEESFLDEAALSRSEGTESAAEHSDDDADDDDEIKDSASHTHGNSSSEGSDVEEDDKETERQRAFFAPEQEEQNDRAPTTSGGSFGAMTLSRPIMKGLSAVGFSKPTPIQAKAIPIALAGKDVVGGAVTGSGKTAAFVIPILERLLYRPKRVPTTRVAILMPTRELAVQCYNVATKLAAFTDIKFGQAIGGMNQRVQETHLKTRPDVVIATPGRFIDFMRNYTCLVLDTIEILVLDEADRMLEEGFADELNEILTTIPKSRQTMLFSATMTSNIDNLIRVGLQRPVRLMVDPQKQTVAGLVQEFVRLRPGKEHKRLAYLLHLCAKVFTNRVIVFFRQKKEAHRVRVIFALCGMKAAELHGSMSQEQRLDAIDSFRSGSASYLLATDLASRGLDIKGIDTVINYEAPQTHEIYLHRVGRTARAGRSGRSLTLAAEPDRKVVKAAVKAAKAQGAVIKQRTIDTQDADAWVERIEKLHDDIEAVLREEKEERAMAQTERDLNRADNIVKHEDEIKSRPKKTWFETEDERQAAKDKGRVALNGPETGTKKKKTKLSNKEKKKLQAKDDRKAGLEWRKGKVSVTTARPGKGNAKKKPSGFTKKRRG